MFTRLNRSWSLVKASAAVLRSDKELIVFVITSWIACLLVALTFIVPAGFYTVSHHLFTITRTTTNIDMPVNNVLAYGVMFAFYVTQYFVIFFANTALVGAALIRLRGGKPTLRDGFQLALNHVGPIFGYAVIASTVGMVLRSLSERSGLLGRIVVGLIGMAWTVASYLVVPVLVTENVGPIEAVKRSTELLKRTWGEQIVGNAGISLAFSLIALLVIVGFVPLLVIAISIQSVALMIAIAVLFVLALTTLCLIQSALTGIYVAAVYLFAADGFVGDTFQADHIRDAFRTK